MGKKGAFLRAFFVQGKQHVSSPFATKPPATPVRRIKMKKFFSSMMLAAFAAIISNAQEAPKNFWQAQELAKKIFESNSKMANSRSAEATPQVAPEPYVVLRSNLGEFSNASPAVEIRMDVTRAYDAPVFVGVQVTKWTGTDQITLGYTVPDGAVYGMFDRLQEFGTYTAYRSTFPEAAFGDMYGFVVSIYDRQTQRVIQTVSTRFIVAGDGSNHRSPYHLDGATYQDGYLYLKGSFPKVSKVWIRLGDPRSNSTGMIEGKVVSNSLIVAPLNLPMVNNYAFPYDVVLYISEFAESYSLPGGLKLDAAQQQATPAPPPIMIPQK